MLQSQKRSIRSWTRFAVAVAAGTVLFCSQSAVGQQKRIYIAPDDHTDYMWTADEKTYEKAILGMTDYYLDLADKTAADPSNLQSRWNFDGSLWMWLWEQNRKPDQVERLVKRLRDGHFSMPLTFAASTYGAQPAEAVLRGMYYAGDVERRFQLRFPMAIAMENQTLPRGLGALFAGAGAKYSWRGVCACDTKLLPAILQPRPQDIYWWKGPDASRILLKWYSYYPSSAKHDQSLGSYAEAFNPTEAVRFVEKDHAFQKANPYDIIGIFGEGWDHLSTTDDKFIQTAKALSTPDQTVIVSNEEDFFRDFEQQYGAKLPEVSVSFGNEWDLYSASMPELSAGVRRAVEKLRTAEAMSVLVSLKQPDFYADQRAARQAAWAALGLFWEHDWTGDTSILTRTLRAEWQQRTALKITSYIDPLLSTAGKALGQQIVRHGEAPRYYVFNPLNWKRTDAADLPYTGTEEIHVTDLSTAATVPSQFVNASQFDGSVRRVLRIWTTDVPPVGYKVFEVVPGRVPGATDLVHANGDTLENADYRIVVTGSGSISSIISKQLNNREMATEVDGRRVNDWGSGDGTVTVLNQGPVSATLVAKSPGPIPRQTEITLYRNSDRIDIRNEILGNFTDVRTWAFSFNLKSPDVWHEEIGAINHARLEPEGDYAARLSRLDWLSLNHFATMSDPNGAGVTLSNADCFFIKLGRSNTVDGVTTLDTSTSQFSVLAGGQADGPKLGVPALFGETHIVQRFALQIYPQFSTVSSMRFAMEHQNPLTAEQVTGGSSYPETKFSLLSTSDPNLILWALKPAEDGIKQGVVARFWSVDQHSADFIIKFAGGISKAWNVTHIETDTSPASVASGELISNAAPWQIRTFRWLPLEPRK